jgi:DNA-binding CsgD family transcriptional regulator
MLADAAIPQVRGGDAVVALETARRAADLARDAGPAAAEAEWAYAAALVVNGRAPEASELVDRWVAVLDGLDTPLVAMRLAQSVPRVLIWLERYEAARRLLDRLVGEARDRAPGTLPWALGTTAELGFRTGRWQAARAAAAEGAELGRDLGQPLGRAFCLASLARVDAGRGDEEACRAHAAEAREVGARLGSEAPMLMLGEQALGLLGLSLGRPEEALAHLRPLGDVCRRRGLEEPGVVQYAPNLVEALLRAGPRDEAEVELERLEAQTERTGRAWARAAAARCRGLLADGDAYEEPLRRALAEPGDMPFERARTQLALGERLRRDRRRADARAHLAAALTAFEGLGAEPWAERARVELRATGETARRRSEPRSDALTPQELQVAIMVSDGATNKEAGARLFLSAKTIEAHLGRIYRKLGVRSRTELASLILREQAEAPVAG